MEQITHFINGKFESGNQVNWIDNIEPATGKVYSIIANAQEETVNKAVIAAELAFDDWSNASRSFRSACLNKLANLVEQNLPQFAAAETKDNGKPLHVATAVDIPRAISNLRFFASAILHQSTEAHEDDQLAINFTLRQPFGVVACISPWNLPLYLFTWKVAPALAVGNTVVAKPSEITPYTAFLLSKLINDAGFPGGVFNIVHGTGVDCGEALVNHPKVKAITFTGGTKTGSRIASIAAPQFKKLSLELGGKNPTLVFDDCDFDATVSEVARSSFSNQGQICLCGSRILIQRNIYNRFRDSLIEKVKKIKVGQPFDPDVQMGALVSATQLEKVKAYVQQALQDGGMLLTGGNQIHLSGEFEHGYYFEPTVFEGLNNQCAINQEEVFGPVITLQAFDNVDEAIAIANDSNYGLAASVWTQNITTANRVAEKLKTGIVWINCWMLRDLRTPFGGTKNSGVGREGGWEAIRFFTEAKNVCIKK